MRGIRISHSRSTLSGIALLLAPLLLLLCACGGARSEAKLQYAQTERKAARYRLSNLKATAEQDQRRLELKRAAIQRAGHIDATAFSGKGAFISLNKAFFSSLLESLLPFDFEKDGFRFRFTKQRLDLSPEGILVQLGYKVQADAFKRHADQAPEGHLRCRLSVLRNAKGDLLVHITPELLQVEDRYYRAARTLQDLFKPQAFTGFLPDLPLPLVLPNEIVWEDRTQMIDMRFDPSQMLVMSERVLMPFSFTVTGAPRRSPEPTAREKPKKKEPTRPTIPVGLTPKSR